MVKRPEEAVRLLRWSVLVVSMFTCGGATGLSFAAAPAIGMASSPSDGLSLDHSRVSGNATVFDGSTVQSTSYTRIHLNNGTRLDLSAGSSAQVFQHRTALQSGMSEIQSSSGYEIDVKSLKVLPEAANSIARVKLESDKRVLVTALNAPVNIRNADGMLVARLLPSKSMAFVPQAGAAAPPFSGSGCVLQKGTSAVFVEDGSRQIFELRGSNFDNSLIGNRAMVVGVIDSSSTPTSGSGAQQVLNFTSISQTKRDDCRGLAKAIGAVTTGAGYVVPEAVEVGTLIGFAVGAGLIICAAVGCFTSP